MFLHGEARRFRESMKELEATPNTSCIPRHFKHTCIGMYSFGGFRGLALGVRQAMGVQERFISAEEIRS